MVEERAETTEETGNTETKQTPATETIAETQATETPASEAKPQESDWRASIEDEKLRKVADRYASPADAIKAINDFRNEASARIKPLGEDATDEDKAKFRKALGVPDDVAGYEVAAPEGYDWTDDDQAMFDLVAPIAHEYNMPKAALEGFVNAYLGQVTELTAAAEKQIADAQAEAEATLKTEWGPDFEANKVLASRFAKFGSEDFNKLLNTPMSQLTAGGDRLLGDHPDVIRFLATMGRRVGEDGLQLSGDPAETQSAQSRINEITKEHPVGSPGYNSRAVQAELDALYAKIHPSNA